MTDTSAETLIFATNQLTAAFDIAPVCIYILTCPR